MNGKDFHRLIRRQIRGDGRRRKGEQRTYGCRQKKRFRQKETSNEGRLKADRMNDWMQTD